MSSFYQPADGYARRLKSITDELLSRQADYGRLHAAATELYSFFSSITGLNDEAQHPDNAEETWLASGQAISPRDAARCALDCRRTAKFLQGAQAAILAAQQRFPHTTIEILYAGCGPFAPLAIPLTNRFSAAEIQFTLLDIHQRSLDATRQLCQAFGLSSFVRDRIQCDAASYRHNGPQPLHIVLTETMQAALEQEPQVAITLNLAPQLCPGGIFIPERITVEAWLCDLTKEFTTIPAEAEGAHALAASRKNRYRIPLGKILDLTAAGCRNRLVSSSDERVVAARPRNIILDAPLDLDQELNLMLSTAITVFDSVALGESESGLTCPRVLPAPGKIGSGARIEFAYCLENKPGFKCQVL